ncbi:MAG: FGGY-family carbohydrate kinase [Gammaproteobacteria bacterium]|nr:FGGY-family carbohydrate kinase [Gammaproteobacteria bacterium]
MTSEPLVIGLDSSTQSTKAIAWNAAGQVVAEGRADIAMNSPRLNWMEQDPEHWWQSCITALKGCMRDLDPARVQGLAISNQRETLGFVDKDGDATHPAIVWLDERSRAEVQSVAAQIGADNIHRITGRPVDITPCLYRFQWMKTHRPEVYQKTACFVDVQCFLVKRLCGGDFRTGWISADPMGLVDMETHEWSQELLEFLELDTSRLPELCAPGSQLGEVTAAAAEVTGLPPGLPVFAAGGDGQLAGLGTNCTIPDRAYINLGTAVVSGIWSPEYRYHKAWRTELAAQGEGYIFESCLRSGAFLVNWFVEQFVAHGKADAAVFQRLEQAALKIPIGADGLLLQPYFSGVMNPHWDIDARGVLLGLSGGHTDAHIYRAIIEGITLDQVRGTLDLETHAGQPITHYVAIGGGANSPLWRQMLADASGRPVHVSDTIEASALGAGMIAAFGAGWFSTITEAADAMAGSTTPVEPQPTLQAVYQELLEIYQDVYTATADLNHRMVAFAAAQTDHR